MGLCPRSNQLTEALAVSAGKGFSSFSRGIRLSYRMYQVAMSVPLRAADAAMPIHRPLSPHHLENVQQKSGRNRLELMLHTLGGRVLPIPRKTPEEAPSSAIKTWQNARMRRYVAPISRITGGSLRNRENKKRPPSTKSAVTRISQPNSTAREIR